MTETGSTFTVRRKPWLLSCRWMAVGIVIVLATIVSASRLEAQLPDVLPPHIWQFIAPQKAQDVATQTTKRILPQLVRNDEDHAKQLGFDSSAQVVGAQFPLELEAPFALLRISLARLKAIPQTQGHPDDTDVTLLFLDKANSAHEPILFPARFLFPISVQNKVKSSVLVAFSLRDKRWRLQQVGSPKLIGQLKKYGKGVTHFAVWIPDLNRYYLGRRGKDDSCDKEKDKFIITAVFDDPAIPLEKGQSKCASLVINRLKAEADKISDAEAH